MQKNLLNSLLIILLFLAGIYLLKSQTRCQWKEPTPNPNRPIVTRELNCDNADSRVSLNGSVERQNSREVLGQKHKQNVGAEENISTVNSQYPLSYLYHPPHLTYQTTIPHSNSECPWTHFCPPHLTNPHLHTYPSKCRKINDNYGIISTSPPL